MSLHVLTLESVEVEAIGDVFIPELLSCCTSLQCWESNKLALRKQFSTLLQSSPLTNSSGFVGLAFFRVYHSKQVNNLLCSYNLVSCGGLSKSDIVSAIQGPNSQILSSLKTCHKIKDKSYDVVRLSYDKS